MFALVNMAFTNTRGGRAIVLLCAGGLFAGLNPVHAQESKMLEEVVITATSVDGDYARRDASTATKTDTPLLETPVNIQVVTQQVLQDQKDINLDGALKNISGVLSYSQSGNLESITIRGFDTNQTIFLDGFRMYDHFSAGLQPLTNIDRVEVMKGPAATLYGQSEPGGIVNLVSKQPQATPYLLLEQSAGSWRHYLTKIDATGPMNESKTLLYRLDGSYDRSDSWRDGIWSRSEFIAPSFTWIVSPQVKMTFRLTHNHNPLNSDNGQILPLVNNQIVPLPRSVNFYDPAYTGGENNITTFGFDVSYEFNQDWAVKGKLFGSDASSSGIGVNAGGFLAPGTPGNIGNGWNVQLGYPQYQSGAASYQQSSERNKATEIDLTGHFETANLKHTVLIGGNYQYHSEPVLVVSGSPNSTPVLPAAFTAGAPISLDPNNLYFADSHSFDFGAYIQDQVKLPHHLDLLAGLSYQDWRTNGSSATYGSTNIANGFASSGPTQPYGDSAVTPRIGAVWEAETWLSVYAQYSDNFFPNTAYDYLHRTIKATGARNREVGVKTEFDGGRLQSTVAYYDLTKTNVPAADTNPAHLILPECRPTGPGCSIAIGEINSHGLELDIQGRITPAWNVIVTYAFTDAKVTFDPNVPSTQGHRLQNVPHAMGSVWTTYDLRQGDSAVWTFGGGTTARGSSVDGSNTVTTPGYVVFDAMARYSKKWRTSKLTLQLNATNIFNTDYYANGGYDYAYNGAPFTGVTYGLPRFVEGTVRLEY